LLQSDIQQNTLSDYVSFTKNKKKPAELTTGFLTTAILKQNKIT